MYAVRMLTERLQILIDREQRRRLEDEARRSGVSVGAVVREAIDARVGAAAIEQRMRAVEAIKRLQGTYLAPEELDEIIGEERLRAAHAE